MHAKIILISAMMAYVDARFGQEQVPIQAISQVKGGQSGQAATVAGAAISDLLGAANACAKLTRADQIVSELGGGADAIAAAIGMVAAEKNTNPFANNNTQNVCADPALPATAQLRGITPLIDPAAPGAADVNALSAKTKAAPLDATGKSVFDLIVDAGFGSSVAAQQAAGGAAAAGNAGNANQNANQNQNQNQNANKGNGTANANANKGNNGAKANKGNKGAKANKGNKNQGNNNANANQAQAANGCGQQAAGNQNKGNQNKGNQSKGNANKGNANKGNASKGNAGNAAASNATQAASNSNSNANANAGNQNAGNAAGNAAAGSASQKSTIAGLDFGSCVPTMIFEGGLGGRPATEFTFQLADPVARQGQQEALNPNIITNRICDQLTNVCNANAAAKSACQDAKTKISALGTRDKSTADAWNTQLGFAGFVTNPDGGPADKPAAAGAAQNRRAVSFAA